MTTFWTTTTLTEDSTVTMLHQGLDAVADVFIENFGEDGVTYKYTPTYQGIEQLVAALQEHNPSAILLFDSHEMPEILYYLTRKDVEEYAGRPLTHEEAEDFTNAFPNTSVDQCISGCLEGLNVHP